MSKCQNCRLCTKLIAILVLVAATNLIEVSCTKNDATGSTSSQASTASTHSPTEQARNVFLANDSSPRILTNALYITSYEHYTVVLPCEIQNLPNDMHVIWQYGRRGERNQTVLTIGGSQIIDNYRVRAITNETRASHFRPAGFESSSAASGSGETSSDSRTVTSVNLEIRKLQFSDSGWYECQLPTKPTQINYVYLQVLGVPKIEVNPSKTKLGDTVELVCKMRNLPANQEIHWLFNDNKINANVIYKSTSRENEQTNSITTTNLKAESTGKQTKEKTSKTHHNPSHSKSKRFDHVSPTFVVELEKLATNNQNITISKLIIKDLDHHHKGLYKCKYDKVEAKYHLDWKFKERSKVIHVINHQQFVASKAARPSTVNFVWPAALLTTLCSYSFFSSMLL